MKRIYLHIGLMKTGSTALQEFLAANRTVLAKQNCAYPLMHIGPTHTYDLRNAHFLIYDSPSNDPARRKAEELHILQKGISMLEKAFQEADTVILSDEKLWYAQNWLRFRPRLMKIREQFGCEIKVIVYLRRQDQFVESYWNQKVKGASRYTMSFSEFLLSSHCAGILPDYNAQLDLMRELYGKENIIVRVYEPDQFDGGSIFSDFIQHTGLALTDEYQFPESPSNLQLTDNFIEIKRQINELTDYRDTDNFYRAAMLGASEAAGRIGNEKNDKVTFFPEGGQAAYVEQFREGNANIAREYLGREDGVLFHEKIKPLDRKSVV